MKKITFLFFLIGTVYCANAQVLNQNAAWPNPAWTVTGSYNAVGLQSNPTLTANFAFDDDRASTGSGQEDNIAAESPVIDLTPAFTAGQTWLTVSAQYVYRYIADDELVFQYWNADTSLWVNWGTNFDALGNYTANANYCSGTPSTYTSPTLNIGAFTPTQLAGFKYRISYDDNPAGADYNWGFCFQSPTIVSSTPPACPSPTLPLAAAASTSATLSWTENGSATLYNVEYGPNGFVQGAGTLLSGVSNSYNLSPLTPNTAYSYYVQAACGGINGNSTWVGPYNFTTLFTPPANNDCAGAVALTVNADFACGTTTAGTTQGATLSMAASPCFGNPDDDVWYSFVATATSHRIVLSNTVAVGGTGTSTDAYMQVLSGACGSQTSVLCSDPNTANPTGLTIGNTYFVRVYTYGNTNNITFNICVGTPPPPPPAPANDECLGAIGLTVNPDYACGTVTAGTTYGGTLSMAATPCFGNPDDDVWFSFVATATSHRIVLSNIVAVGGTGTSTDAYMQVLSGSCGSQTSVLCSDPNTGNATGLTIGDRYYVRVYTYGNANNITFDICVGTPPPPPPAPANDECTGAIALTVNANLACGTVTAGTTSGATASATDATACSGTEDDDVWFSFVATNTTHRISLSSVAGSVTDMYHSLWTGNCAGLTLVPGTCSDGDTSNPAGLVIGQTYYVRVNTYTATAGQLVTFNICIGTPPPPPANDSLANAIAISCGNTYTGDTTLATLDEDNAPDGFGTDMDAPNVWYTFTGTGSAQTVTLNLCGSAYDTSVLVYTGTSGALTLVAANDDDASCNATNDSTRSRVSFSSDGTTTYRIAIEGWNSGSIGAFTLDVTCAVVNPPAVANQTCATALNVLVDGSDNNSDNSFGTINSTQPTCDSFGSVQDVWFSFVAPASGEISALLTRGTMTSLNYSLYSGACGTLTAVGTCTSNVITATSSQAYTGLTAGNTYYIQVWSSGSEQGTFTLKLTNTLGTNPFDSTNFTYYPNPVKNVLNLSYNQEISSVEVFNLLGQKVSINTINANDAQVDMSHLSSGTYMVKVTSDNQVKTIKVVKE
jgi:hypothetical protein